MLHCCIKDCLLSLVITNKLKIAIDNPVYMSPYN